ncbi:MAG TPA: iron ABC transporter permease [Acidimicrobiia bacterium]|nr:iron ABC transporter permease [Acidimicrobiia bacterium]
MDGRDAVKGRRLGWLVLGGVPLVFLAYFFVYPLVTIVATALSSRGDGAQIGEVLASSSLRGVVWFTTWQAVVSTVLTLLVGIPGAHVIARFAFRGRKLIRALTVVPFVLPTVVVGSAFLALLGPRGVLGVDLSRSVLAIVLAHVFFNYAVIVRTVGSFWEGLDPRIEDAARALGASRWQTFRSITLPLLAPSIAAASSIVFLFTFTSFGIVLILGGVENATIEVEIWRQAIGLLDLRVAAVLALLQLGGIALLLWWYTRTQAGSRQLRTSAGHRRRPHGAERVFLASNLLFMAALLGAPVVVMLWRSIAGPDGLSLVAYADLGVREPASALFVPALDAIGNSLRFALTATVLAVIVGAAAAAIVAYRPGPIGRTFDIMLMLPLGTSAVTLGFGFLVALDAPIDLRTWPWLIPIAHALVAIPFVVRTTVPVMRRVQVRLREAAATLGASPARAWREVDLPLVARAVLVGAGFAFAVSLGEFGATSFIARPDAPTLPIAIFRLLGQPGTLTFGRAMALSVILMVLTALAVLAIERLRPEGGDGF